MHRATNFNYSVGQPTTILSQDTHTHPTGAAHMQHSFLMKGPRQEFAEGAEGMFTCRCKILYKKIILNHFNYQPTNAVT